MAIPIYLKETKAYLTSNERRSKLAIDFNCSPTTYTNRVFRTIHRLVRHFEFDNLKIEYPTDSTARWDGDKYDNARTYKDFWLKVIDNFEKGLNPYCFNSLKNKNVTFYFSSFRGRELLFTGEDFQSEIMDRYNENIKDIDSKHLECIRILHKQFADYPDKTINMLFEENVMLDFAFAQELKRFDEITHDCFIAKTELGEALLQLVCFADMIFIVVFRRYLNKNEIHLCFSICHDDYSFDLQNILSGTKIFS